MKRAAPYSRVSTIDQNPETQLSELRQFAANKGFQVVGEYTTMDTAVRGRDDRNSTA